jgi:hypothetical protein
MVAGMIAFGGASADGVSGSDWSGLLMVPVGLVLIAMAAWMPWHERGRHARTPRRRWAQPGRCDHAYTARAVLCRDPDWGRSVGDP